MGGIGTKDSVGGRGLAVLAAVGLLFGALLLVVIAPGCRVGTLVSDLQFSPDGRSLAYYRLEGSFFGIPKMGLPILGFGSGHGESCWLEVTRPEEVHRVPIYKGTLTPFSRRPPKETFYRDMEVVFSPDSQHTAEVLEDSGDIVIISRDGKHWKLPEAHDVRSVTWVSCEEVAYATVVRKKGDDGLESQTLVVWRQGVFAPFHRRELYRREAGWFKCFFSPPSGGNLLLYEYDRGGRYWLVDLASGKMVDLAPDGEGLRSVAWSTDGSKLLLAIDDAKTEPLPSGAVRFDMHYTAFDTKTERRAGWSETYETDSGDTWFALASRWTADGRYVVLAEYARGWSLVDPWNQERVSLSDRLAPHLEHANAQKVLSVGPLPVEGWIWVEVRLREPARNQQVFAMDYSGEHFVPLADRGTAWAVSPDATRVAEGDKQGRVKVRTLTLPRAE